MATVKQDSAVIEMPHKYIGDDLTDIDATTIPAFSTYYLTDGAGTFLGVYISDGTRWNG